PQLLIFERVSEDGWYLGYGYIAAIINGRVSPRYWYYDHARGEIFSRDFRSQSAARTPIAGTPIQTDLFIHSEDDVLAAALQWAKQNCTRFDEVEDVGLIGVEPYGDEAWEVRLQKGLPPATPDPLDGFIGSSEVVWLVDDVTLEVVVSIDRINLCS
ncbi:MAG: hypothetical protein IIC82_06785, partial [Chloroflexi bacterium]|nr:hypothetical protein [Chloroflexota bacterium]